MLNNEKTAVSQPQLAQINLTGLPSQLQLELIDFYGFLIQKYLLNEKAPEPQTAFKRFLDTLSKRLKFNRGLGMTYKWVCHMSFNI
ncbi:hypothetical protein [Methylovulum psychrotolerans]|uniref:Uncharacterized protein n=1 Tax=Methylovulum psychrotolerans TaxID=1704499 RepID=A0A2S5CK84_9GAMM|nr:hypothetical protein [Methylovulum psychrotolerans]POZ51230.1 hypothetical protein AADEFJLK_03194 [Methylovulum psychrotolerans]